eukprot:3297590-Pyramimonas_sp.AAC.1
MGKCRAAPFPADRAAGVDVSDAGRLEFIEPQTSCHFDFRKRRVTRAGPQISRAIVLAATARHGRVMHADVIVDAGHEDADDMDWSWLHLYVAFSRATASDNL